MELFKNTLIEEISNVKPKDFIDVTREIAENEIVIGEMNNFEKALRTLHLKKVDEASKNPGENSFYFKKKESNALSDLLWSNIQRRIKEARVYDEIGIRKGYKIIGIIR